MSGYTISEREENNRYEARVIYRGILFSRVFYLSGYGWPYDYKHQAHEEIHAAILAELQ